MQQLARLVVLSFVLIAFTGLVGCSRAQSGSFLVRVTDRSNWTPIEGATIEIDRASVPQPTNDAVRSTTDGRGETVVYLPAWDRMSLRVTFDGETELYHVFGDRLERWDAPVELIDGPAGSIRFIRGPKGEPIWKVMIVRVR
jgi:hypothetical protein